jgi:outer membrane protein assembly factor BamD
MKRRHLVRLAAVVLMFGLLGGCWWKDDEEELVVDNTELYRQAVTDIAEGRFFRASERLGEVGLTTAVSPELDPYVKLAIADSYFFRGGTINAIEAQSRYEQFLSFYPTHPMATYARFQVGVCLFRQSERPENDQEYTLRARNHFRDMLRDLPPDHPWRLAAAAMRQRAEDKLARHEWQVAAFYVEKEEPLGAIERLERLIREYPGARVRRDAMLVLARAYADVGDYAQARLTVDMLVDEYPAAKGSNEVAALRERIESGLAGGRDGTAAGSEAAAVPEPEDGTARSGA